MGLYVNYFVFFGVIIVVGEAFENYTTELTEVYFIGTVSPSIPINFSWKRHYDGNHKAHLIQQ